MKLNYYFAGTEVDPYEFEVAYRDADIALRNLLKDGYDEDRIHDLFLEYEDELREWFRQDAYESYTEEHLLATNPDAYYGVNRRD